jgi:hypothetical protein
MKILVMTTIALSAWNLSVAQTLTVPSPAKAVYKCVVSGKVVYSDDPCLGASKVDIQPNRGVDKLSGKQVVGSDVAREQYDDLFAKGIALVTGLTPGAFQVQVRRASLPDAVKRECEFLDSVIPKLEDSERAASRSELGQIQRSLLERRMQYRDKRC